MRNFITFNALNKQVHCVYYIIMCDLKEHTMYLMHTAYVIQETYSAYRCQSFTNGLIDTSLPIPYVLQASVHNGVNQSLKIDKTVSIDGKSQTKKIGFHQMTHLESFYRSQNDVIIIITNIQLLGSLRRQQIYHVKYS